MPLTHPNDDILIAVALCRFESEFEDVDPELSEWTGLLAAVYLEEIDMTPRQIVDALEIGP